MNFLRTNWPSFNLKARTLRSCISLLHYFNTICPWPENGTFGVPEKPRPGRGTMRPRHGTSREIQDGWQPYLILTWVKRRLPSWTWRHDLLTGRTGLWGIEGEDRLDSEDGGRFDMHLSPLERRLKALCFRFVREWVCISPSVCLCVSKFVNTSSYRFRFYWMSLIKMRLVKSQQVGCRDCDEWCRLHLPYSSATRHSLLRLCVRCRSIISHSNDSCIQFLWQCHKLCFGMTVIDTNYTLHSNVTCMTVQQTVFQCDCHQEKLHSFLFHLYEQFLQVKQIGFVTLGPLCCA